MFRTFRGGTRSFGGAVAFSSKTAHMKRVRKIPEGRMGKKTVNSVADLGDGFNLSSNMSGVNPPPPSSGAQGGDAGAQESHLAIESQVQ